MFFKLDSRDAWVNLDYVTGIKHDDEGEGCDVKLYILGDDGFIRLTRVEYAKLLMVLPVATPFKCQR